MAVLASVGVNAADLGGVVSGVSGNSTYDPKTQTLEVTRTGALAEWVEAITTGIYADGGNNPFNGFGGSDDFEKLVITGELNAADLAALSSAKCAGFARFPQIDMTGVTLASGVTVDDVLAIDFGAASFTQNSTPKNGAGAEYIALPYGVTEATDLAKLKSGSKNSNLKVAGTYDITSSNTIDRSHFSAYSFASNNMWTFVSKLFPDMTYWERSNSQNEADWYPAKLTLGGVIGATDLYTGSTNGKVFKSKALHDFDLTECNFDENCTVDIKSNLSYGGTENPCSGVYENPAQLTCTSTNAMYFLSWYEPMRIIMPRDETEIPPCTFDDNTKSNKLEKITFPEGAAYTKIGFEAFYKCAIDTLKMPGSVTEVGEGAFSGCDNMTDFTMEACQSTCVFKEQTFTGCKNIKHVTLSEGVDDVSYMMFNQCASLEEIRIPNTCTHIDSYAFNLCFSLHSLTIPRSVRTMGHGVITLSGIKDIYLLAESVDEVPLIYAVPESGSCPVGTFSDQNINGNNTDPRNGTREYTTDLCHTGIEEALTWYQEAMSGSAGLGTGNCMTLIHFPDQMRDFYDGIGTPAEQARWKRSLANNSDLDHDIINAKIEKMESMDDGHQWISDGYGYGSAEYDRDHTSNKGNSDPSLITGCDHQHECSLDDCTETGGVCSADCPLCEPIRTWPVQSDYAIRRAAGAVGCLDDDGNPVATKIAWRQFPLMTGVEAENKKIVPLEYDDTWYTMCFPWHLTDNQLFEAFNQKCEITEFVGVELIDQTPGSETDKEYEMVLHFDDVAKTYYMDKEDIYYDREFQEQRTITYNGVTISKNYYTYYELDGKDGNRTGVSVTDPADFDEKTDPKNNPEKTAQHVRYLSIQNIIPLAGRPYMIHPSVGAAPGNPTICNFVAVEERYGTPWTTAEQAVTKVATTDDQRIVNNQNKGGQTAFVNPQTNGGGSYTFIGNVGNESEEDTSADANGNKVMPTPAYFLAVEKTGTETVTVTDYEEHTETVYEADGVTPVYNYTYVGTGGNVRYEYADEQYNYVGTGGNYVPTAFQPVTTRTDTYDYNTSAFTYQQGGNYVPATYTENTGNGAYNKTVEAHYEHTYQGGGSYKATKFEAVTDGSGQYNGTQPYDYYSFNGWGDTKVISAEPVSGGAYDAEDRYIFTENEDGDYDGVFEYVGQRADACYYLEDGKYKYNQYGWQYYIVTGYTPNASGTGNFKKMVVYVFVGEGNGQYDVRFDSGENQWSNTNYSRVPSDLQYVGTTGGSWKVTEYTEVGKNQGDWNYIPDQYEYVGNGGNYDAATFTQVENGQGTYVKNGAEYVYNASGTGAYEPTEWEAVTAGQGTYTHIPEHDSYIDVADNSGDYMKTVKTTTTKVEVGTHQETHNVYAKYPKYYRKKTTSGNKWSRYSAIIKPDADAIANIESFLDMSASNANGFNVAFGEWEIVTPTAIEDIVSEAERNNEPVQKVHLNVVYNVKGQVVRNSGSLEGLPKGLYIVNGKKYMVK